MSKILWMAAGVLLSGVVVAGGFSFSALSNAQDKPLEAASATALVDVPRVTRVGDEVRVHLALFDAQGRMLLSSRASDRAELERTQAGFPGAYALPLKTEDSLQSYVITNGSRPMYFDANSSIAIGQELVGKPVGYVGAFPLVGRPVGYENVTTLERTRGPFNRTLTLSTATLDNLTGGDAGMHVVLDDLFEADVLERGPVVSRIRLDVRDGQVIPVRRAGFDATVLLDEAADQFHLHLDAAEGHAFALQQSCKFARYVLPPGSYRVTAVDDATLTLASSPTKWPQLIGRDLVMVLEIISIQGTEVNGV